MYYHSVAILPGNRRHRWWNRSKDNTITDVLVPFLNGQIIAGKWVGRGGRRFPCLINMKAVDHFVVFKTEHRLSKQEVSDFKRHNSVGNVCTAELIKEIRFDRATEQVKSLMQRLIEPPKRQIFVIMALNNRFLNSAYKGVIKPLGEKLGYKVVRVDEIENSGMVTAQIIDGIAESQIVISDLTDSRPNCYYETGIAYATGKELILCIREDEHIHFDLSVNRFIKWETEEQLRTALRQRLEAIENE
jgi:hypothetical protein